jgi:hypothetical protein
MISGVVDQQVYSDSVAFTVHSEAGFEYQAELNNDPVPTDVLIPITEAEYYELLVYRRNLSSGAEETELVRFIVKASERGDSEIGLPLWTPFPPIPSAPAEFAGAQLQIVFPADYPMGLEIPIIARVQEPAGKRLGVVGVVTAPGFEEYPLQVLRGVGSVFLPGATVPGVIEYNAQIHALQSLKQVTIEPATTWQSVSADILSSVNWGEDARIRISNSSDDLLTVGPAAVLTIGAGSVIVVDPDLEIAVRGQLIVNGTLDRPVVFTTQDRTVPWGGFLFDAATSSGQFTGTIFTASGADPNWFANNPGHGESHRKEQCLFYLSEGAEVTLIDCYLTENHGQAGHGENASFNVIRSLVQKCVTTGQYNGGSVTLQDSALIEFPSYTASFADDDKDALYLTGGAHSLTDSLVGWALDDGVDAGSGAAGSVTVDGCWIESCYHEALAWSQSRDADVLNTVTLNCGQGIECGWGAPDVTVTQCLSTANAVGTRFGDCYDWSYDGFLDVTNSLLVFNKRNVWGRAWDDWTEHLAQMHIQDNYLDAPDPNHASNWLWDPSDIPSHLDLLQPFLPTMSTTVGIGLALPSDTLDLTQLSAMIPVRLSTFTTSSVSVDYAVETQNGAYTNGALHFTPGETVKYINFDPPSFDQLRELRVILSNPVNAEISQYSEVIYLGPWQVVEPLPIVEGDDWRYYKGTSEPPAGWNDVSFDDAVWLLGATGIGYESSSGYESCIATNVGDMRNNYVSLYARRLFSIADPSRVTSLTFTMDWDDGYIAYINGVEVAQQFPPQPAAHDIPASGSHEACCGTGSPTGPCPPVAVDLAEHVVELSPGDNVLAVQVHNRSLSSSDLLFIPQLSSTESPVHLYVDTDATGSNDGSSWCNAYVNLQDALAAAEAAGDTVNEIRVAHGVYRPDQQAGQTTGDRGASFQLLNGVVVRGGFAGCGEADPDARDVVRYETVLSGDLNGDDVPGFGNYLENSIHVVTANATNGTAALDGFTITGGFADGSSPNDYGGGILCDNASPTVINCTFVRNVAGEAGGGMGNDNNSEPTLVNCIFLWNHSMDFGGGMGNFNSSPTLLNCVFSENYGDDYGGGISNFGSSPTLTNCILWGDGQTEIFNADDTSAATVSHSCIQGGWPGEGNISDDPLIIVGRPGTEDYRLSLSPGSPCIDAGDNTAVPLDTLDLDGDGNTDEPIPFDLDGDPRFVDDPNTADTGSGTAPIVDLGAYEFQGANPIPAVSAWDMLAMALLVPTAATVVLFRRRHVALV